MALYREGSFVTDPWVVVEGDAPLPAEGPVALPRTRLVAEWDALAGRTNGLGVVLHAGERLDEIVPLLPHLQLVILHVARYADGRHFSTARLLRDRYGYRGELRAAGDVLQDQIVYFFRSGFDSLDVSHPGTIAALRDNRIVAVQHHYQAGWSGAADVPAGTRPWQRRSA